MKNLVIESRGILLSIRVDRTTSLTVLKEGSMILTHTTHTLTTGVDASVEAPIGHKVNYIHMQLYTHLQAGFLYIYMNLLLRNQKVRHDRC